MRAAVVTAFSDLVPGFSDPQRTPVFRKAAWVPLESQAACLIQLVGAVYA